MRRYTCISFARTTLALLVSIGLVGCGSKLESENAMLLDENLGLRDSLDERDRALEQAYSQLRDKDERIAGMQQDLLVRAEQPQQMGDPFGIPGVQGAYGAGEVTATIASDVLFDPGKSELKSSARRSLRDVVRVIRNEYPGRIVRVAGHTDSDPIKKSGHKSNYHLGFERAYVVRQFLVEQGLDDALVYVASHGPDRKLATKPESRRVEIAIVLNDDAAG